MLAKDQMEHKISMLEAVTIQLNACCPVPLDAGLVVVSLEGYHIPLTSKRHAKSELWTFVSLV